MRAVRKLPKLRATVPTVGLCADSSGPLQESNVKNTFAPSENFLSHPETVLSINRHPTSAAAKFSRLPRPFPAVASARIHLPLPCYFPALDRNLSSPRRRLSSPCGRHCSSPSPSLRRHCSFQCKLLSSSCHCRIFLPSIGTSASTGASPLPLVTIAALPLPLFVAIAASSASFSPPDCSFQRKLPAARLQWRQRKLHAAWLQLPVQASHPHPDDSSVSLLSRSPSPTSRSLFPFPSTPAHLSLLLPKASGGSFPFLLPAQLQILNPDDSSVTASSPAA